MKMKMQYLHLCALGIIAACASGEHFAAPARSAVPSAPAAAGLPEWDFDGRCVHAKDEKTAVKYARKRGFYREGMTPVRISR